MEKQYKAVFFDLGGTLRIAFLEGQDVGSPPSPSAEPDQVYFAGKTLSLDYEKTSDLGLTVKSSLRDITITTATSPGPSAPDRGTSADGISTIVDNQLHTAAKAEARPRKAEITVTYTKANGRSSP